MTGSLEVTLSDKDAEKIVSMLKAELLPEIKAILSGLQIEPQAAYITKAELAKRLKVSLRTVDNRVLSGELPEPVKIGALRRWRVADLIERGA